MNRELFELLPGLFVALLLLRLFKVAKLRTVLIFLDSAHIEHLPDACVPSSTQPCESTGTLTGNHFLLAVGATHSFLCALQWAVWHASLQYLACLQREQCSTLVSTV
jgi:hypothetical protein